MPELPEVEVIRQGLIPHLEGLQLSSVKFLRRDLREPIPCTQIQKNLVGYKITSISRRSKYLIFTMENHHAVIFHLGMSGQMPLLDVASPQFKHTHAVFTFQHPEQKPVFLHYVDPRRFGIIQWAQNRDHLPNHRFFKHLGPEPLEGSNQHLTQRLIRVSQGRKVPVKTFIMNAEVVVGVGNIYANEALHSAGIHPLLAACELDATGWQRLASKIRSTLRAAIRQGGTTLKDYRHSDGSTGYFQVELAVYGRGDQPCKTCKCPIEITRLSGRATYFCPSCQPATV